MRIATSQLYTSSVATMEDQQSQLLTVQQQISTGVSLTNPADNPLAAAQAVQLSATGAALAQYSTNQNSALSSLQVEDSTLSSVTTTLQSINSLMQEAMNGSLNDSDRAAIAQQMTGYRNQLLTLANTTDGAGNYIFSGFQSTSQVFTNKAGGGVTYNGDNGQRLVQVAGSRQIAVSDTGSSVFQSVQGVGSAYVPVGAAGNTGTGTFGAVTVTNPTAPTNADTLSIAFSTASGSLTYTVKDSTTGAVLANNQPYTSGSPIALGTGLSLSISGTPANNDSFTVSPGTANGNTDMFATIDNVISALSTPVGGVNSVQASLENSLTTGMTALGNSLSNVITVQASVGGREQEVKALQTITSTNSLQNTSDLSDLTSTDMTTAISQYTQLENALTASQKSFAATQGLSLFQYINP
jgi:flagellar hook-associated protein 3 FlgL